MQKEMLTIKENETSVEVVGNAINSVRNKDIVKKGGRIFNGNKILAASCVGEISDAELFSQAQENKDGALTFEYPLPGVESCHTQDFLKNKSGDDLFLEYKKALSGLTEKYPDFIFSGKANLTRVKKELNHIDRGAVQLCEYDICSWSFIYKHKKSSSIIDGFFGAESVGDFSIVENVENYFKYLDAFNEVVPIESGPLPVVFVQPSLLLSKLLENTRIDFYKKDIGPLKGMLGEKVFDEKFSLYDVSYDPEVLAVSPFDADGVVREEAYLPLFQKGVFLNLICDQKYASKYDWKTTGNSKRSFDSSSSLDFNTIELGRGQRNSYDVISELPRCLVVEVSAGGEFTDTGDYSAPVQNGFVLEHGKVVGRAPQLTLTSSMSKMFGEDLIEVSSDSFSSVEGQPALFTRMNAIVTA